jgi:hypothetical protein
MSIAIGHVEAIYRYPMKSMRGERLESATFGWHGLEGDRAWHSGGSTIAGIPVADGNQTSRAAPVYSTP